MDDRPQIGPTDFEREKWEAELALRKRELVLKEQEQARVASKDFEREKWDTDTALRRRELDLKEKEHDRLVREAKTSRWWNPLVIAIIGATIAAAGSVYVSWNNGSATQQAENLKAESARILEAIKANDPDKAKQNLRFLIATGLISEPTASKILVYLDKQPPGQGPVLPSAGNVGQLFQRAFTGEQSNASPSTPTELRVFAGPNQYPPNLFKAYGILAFPAKSAPEELARHTMFCNAFASTLLDLSGLKAIPAKEEMVTIWPIDSDTDALTINDMPRDSKICDSAVQHYGSAAAQAAIADARKSHAELSGKGPFLLAWSPAESKGQPNASVLVLDFSNVATISEAKAYFSEWSTNIQSQPELWQSGWSVDKIRNAIRDWAGKTGAAALHLDMQ